MSATFVADYSRIRVLKVDWYESLAVLSTFHQVLSIIISESKSNAQITEFRLLYVGVYEPNIAVHYPLIINHWHYFRVHLIELVKRVVSLSVSELKVKELRLEIVPEWYKCIFRVLV